MARPTLTTHPKFFRLAALVGGRGAARGALELIWDAAYASGDPIVGDAIAVEAVADWRGKPGDLAAAMVSSGFLDVLQADANGGHLQTYAVHDLEDHAPDYVLKRWQREAERKQNGETLRSVRQRAAALRWASDDASVRRLQSNVAPPAPAPAPAPRSGSESLPAIPPAPPSGPVPGVYRAAAAPYPVGAITESFLAVFGRYPNQSGRVKAAATWQDVASGVPGGEVALAKAVASAFDAGLLNQHPFSAEHRYQPTFEKFLAGRHWEDPIVPAAIRPAARAGPARDPTYGHGPVGKFTSTGEVKL